MYNSGSIENQHHIATYGDPSVWPYHNFILGANDKAGHFTKFAPKLTSAGGNWDPNAWAQLFKSAGAKFAGPVAEHHDGYSMWNSQVNEWNSVKTGPNLDLVNLHAQAIRGQGLKFMTSLHHAYHFQGYYQYVPQQSTATLQKLYGQMGTTAENQLWYNKLVEVINGYQPDLIWQDFDLNGVQEAERLAFLSYYYNQAVSWNKDVVATYKDGFDTSGEVFDFERGGPGGLLTPYWLTDDSISSSSWCYTVGIGYYTTQALLHALIDRVAKGGNMLLNIAPMADGTIPSGQQTILLAMGDWLSRFGEAVYATRSWTTFGEGPTAMGGGSFSGPKAGVPQDVRFTRSKDNTVLYATSAGLAGRHDDGDHAELQLDQPQHPDLGPAAGQRHGDLHQPAQPHPGLRRPALHDALVQRAVQRPGLHGQADLLRADPHPGRRRNGPDRLGQDRQRRHRAGAGQRRRRRLRLEPEAVELQRQHQPAVAAGPARRRLLPHRQQHQRHGRRQLGQHHQRRHRPGRRPGTAATTSSGA